MNSRILITGSSGFVGTRLNQILSDKGMQIQKADIRDGFDLSDPACFLNIKNIDVVIHLAALKSVPESFKHPWRFLSTNYCATLGALEICRINHARMIYISSYLYGHPQYLPIDEKHPLAPHNPYAQSKKVGEDLCYCYSRDFDIPITLFRPFNIYGPNMKDDCLISTVVKQLDSGRVEILDPEPKRDYLYVDDLCDAIYKAIWSDSKGLDVINLGSGVSVSVMSIAQMIVSQSGMSTSIIVGRNRRRGEVMDCVADISKAKELLGWSPKWSLERGLEKTVKLYITRQR